MVEKQNQTETPRTTYTPAANARQVPQPEAHQGYQYRYDGYYGSGQRYHYHPYRKLYRSGDNKWLGGVCAGLAKYFNTDPLLVRLLWVVLTLASIGVGIIGYILFWLLVDVEPEQYALTKQYVTRDENGREHRHYHYQVS